MSGAEGCAGAMLVRKEGLEPSRFYPPDPKSGASANSATFASRWSREAPHLECSESCNRETTHCAFFAGNTASRGMQDAFGAISRFAALNSPCQPLLAFRVSLTSGEVLPSSRIQREQSSYRTGAEKLIEMISRRRCLAPLGGAADWVRREGRFRESSAAP